MMHRTVHEWGRVDVGDRGFTRTQANSLLAAARAHPLGGAEGTAVLCDHYRYLRAQQMVGVIAGEGCSLEVLPKIDPAAPDEADCSTVRGRLVHMLDVALGLGLSPGETTAMAHGADSLLEVFIALFADMLLVEVRRGVPRLYRPREEDLRAMRGRLDVVRQFTRNAVRQDRLSCRFGELDTDTPLMQAMKACVVLLARLARGEGTRRKLLELRLMLSGVSDVLPARLPWGQVRIDRTSRRWSSLLELARLLLGGRWQQTHADEREPRGITLLFAMNDLFERYIAVQLRRALAGTGLEVVAQGGFRYCLGPWNDGGPVVGDSHPTRPDILVKRGDHVVAVLDTKWKHLAKGVSHADVYQMMAYAQLYRCHHLILLYPSPPGELSGQGKPHGIPQTPNRLDVATLVIDQDERSVLASLRRLLN